MKIAVIGNGALGLAIARQLSKDGQGTEISLFGDSNYEGSGTLAAAAMLTCFAEVEKNSMNTPIEKLKFELSIKALRMWPNYLAELNDELGISNDNSFGFGTYLINTPSTNELDDENFDAILKELLDYQETFQYASNSDIPGYNPKPKVRARRAVYLPNEGWLNPRYFTEKMQISLCNLGVNLIMEKITKITKLRNSWKLESRDGNKYEFGIVILANGCQVESLINNSQLKLDMQKIFFGVGTSFELRQRDVEFTNCIRTPNRGLACGIYTAPFKDPQSKDRILVGATNFITYEPTYSPRLTSLKTLLENVESEINQDFYRAEVNRINIGWRLTSQDTFPLIGKTSYESLYIATGTKRDGVHMSPVVAKYISGTILNKRTDLDFSKFAPERKLIWTMNKAEGIQKAVEHKINGYIQHGMTVSTSRQSAEIENNLRRSINELYDELEISEVGLPVELLDMYKYGHAKI